MFCAAIQRTKVEQLFVCVCESMYARMRKQALHLCVVWCDFWGAHTHTNTQIHNDQTPAAIPLAGQRDEALLGRPGFSTT